MSLRRRPRHVHVEEEDNAESSLVDNRNLNLAGTEEKKQAEGEAEEEEEEEEGDEDEDQPNDVDNQLQTVLSATDRLDPNKVKARIDLWYKHWCVGELGELEGKVRKPESEVNTFLRLRHRFRLSLEQSFASRKVKETHLHLQRALHDLRCAIDQSGLRSHDDFRTYQQRMTRICELVYYSYQTLFLVSSCNITCQSGSGIGGLPTIDPNELANILHTTTEWTNIASMKDRAKFLQFALGHIRHHHLRRRRRLVYERKLHPTQIRCADKECPHVGKVDECEHSIIRDINVHFWQPVQFTGNTDEEKHGSLEKLINASVFPRHYHTEYWEAMANGNLVRSAAQYLENSMDVEFPELQVHRKIFSFSNGLFFAEKGSKFIRFEDYEPEIDSGSACNFIDQPFEYAKYRQQFMSCETKNEPKDEHGHILWSHPDFRYGHNPNDFMGIQSPAFERIPRLQQFADELVRWLHTMCGRQFYNIGDRDRWDVTMFLKGVGATGKSSIVNAQTLPFDPNDVGILMNKVEKNFSLQPLLEAFLWVVYDCDYSFSLDKTTFQNMSCGEFVNVYLKCKDARKVLWKIHGILAGNCFPSWPDDGGAIGRRFMIWEHLFTVLSGDAKLREKIKQELPALIQKWNLAYQSATQSKFADGSDAGFHTIWEMLPDYFEQTKKRMRRETNCSARLVTDPVFVRKEIGRYTSVETFLQALRLFSKKENLNRHVNTFSIQPHIPLLASFGYEVVTLAAEDNKQDPETNDLLVGQYIRDMLIHMDNLAAPTQDRRLVASDA